MAFLDDSGSIPPLLPNRNPEDAFAQVMDPDGRVISASDNIAGLGPVTNPPVSAQALRTLESVLPSDDDSFRVLSRQISVGGQPFVAHVGISADDVGDAGQALVLSLIVIVPIVVVLLAALVWWLVGRTLGPVEEIRREADAIDGGDLRRRVPQPGTDDEIARLAATMNRMLDRIEQALSRQQQFVADASHELRSPLTRIRTELEVDGPAADTVRDSVLEETIELQRLVEDLLYLARADSGAVSLRREPVDLDDVVLRAARRLRANGRVDVDTSAVSGAHVVGDRDQLTRVVRNLADNAERHATASVAFALAETDDIVQLRVSDDGPGIPGPLQENMFERFVRGDEARTRHAGGTGLGLAIAREIVERHGGTISFDGSRDEGAAFVVHLSASR